MDATLSSIFGICFIFLMTSLGASIIFLVKKNLSEKWNVFFLSFAGGIMMASSIWSLLIPAISSAEDYGKFAFLPASVGFIGGCFFMFFLDLILNRSQKEQVGNKAFTKNKKMFFAISLHNIPEGLSVGVALGSAFAIGSPISLISALSLAIGIGIQNIPEGFAVSLPMFEQTGSKTKAFLYGVFSGCLEPVFALVGLLLSSFFSCLLPWLLAFAGGTMIYTVINELLPETQCGILKQLGTWGFIAGFMIMMILDVAFA